MNNENKDIYDTFAKKHSRYYILLYFILKAEINFYRVVPGS